VAHIPTFGPRRSPTDEPSGRREELIAEFWRFAKGLEAQRLRIPGANSGDLLVVGPDGFVITTLTLGGTYVFTDSVSITGTDLTVAVDALELLSRDMTRNLLGDTSLAGYPVVVGNDPPAVASARLGKVDLTAQVADIATTALSSTPPAGVYEVEVYLMTTTADAAAGTLTVTIGWTDNVGATTSTPITLFSLAATGRTTGRQIVRIASGNLTYAVTITGGYGTSAYAIYARVVALG